MHSQGRVWPQTISPLNPKPDTTCLGAEEWLLLIQVVERGLRCSVESFGHMCGFQVASSNVAHEAKSAAMETVLKGC